MVNLISPPPIKDGVLQDNKPTAVWQSWFNDVLQKLTDHSALSNSHTTVNPDFNWSRTKGNTPTTSDGSFVDGWSVKGGGMTYAVTPTGYTSTAGGSQTGSERYVRVVISTINANNFILYQTFPKKMSKYQGQKVTFSAKVSNANAAPVKCKFYIGFDMTGDGSDEYSASSKAIYVQNGDSTISATVECPKVSVDNQTNVVTMSLVLFDLQSAVNLNIYSIKSEMSNNATDLRVDHSIEKYKLDNPS